MNGLFLIFTAFFIFSEGVEVCTIIRLQLIHLQSDILIHKYLFMNDAILSYHQRALEPPDVHHERLLPVSIAGLLVNLVGIFVFQHGGHGHSHDGEGILYRISMQSHFSCY